jgi:hypothetical protein
MTDYVDAIEMAKDIIAVLEHFVWFTEPHEVEDDYAERIKEAYDLLVIDKEDKQ